MNEEIIYEKFQIDQTEYITQTTKKFRNRKSWEQPDFRKITAFIPGTIFDIFVMVGQTVSEGEDLLILEAMKMRNKVKSPVSGKIKSIYVEERQIVPKNFLLIEIE